MSKTYKMKCALCRKDSKTTDKESARMTWFCRFCSKLLVKNRSKVLEMIRRWK